MNMVVKSVANKSIQKVHIIQSVDRKIMLDDLADARSLSMEQLIEEMEAIVYSGTRLDISYYIDDVIEGISRLIDKIPKLISSEFTTSSALYKIYNLGNNQPVNLLHFLQVLENNISYPLPYLSANFEGFNYHYGCIFIGYIIQCVCFLPPHISFLIITPIFFNERNIFEVFFQMFISNNIIRKFIEVIENFQKTIFIGYKN
jgi:hypothetical protein